MQAVWQGYVDGIDGTIFDKSLIRCMNSGNVPLLGVSAGFGMVSCGYSCNDDFRVGLSGLDDSFRPSCCGPSLSDTSLARVSHSRYLRGAEQTHPKCTTAFWRLGRVEDVPLAFNE